ncbi:MAG: hypothetical protein LC104_09750, partial [Bacteroidales bacterium]|nr:hypothetical protein [Bacteroidales bacterium]
VYVACCGGVYVGGDGGVYVACCGGVYVAGGGGAVGGVYVDCGVGTGAFPDQKFGVGAALGSGFGVTGVGATGATGSAAAGG